jgi:uncharacterized repeat protein (TIGR01451 family)
MLRLPQCGRLRACLGWTSMLCAAVRLRLVLTGLLVMTGGPVGCAQHRVPAIDPTGQHILSGTTTTVASHDLLHGLFHKHHQPAETPVGPPVIAAPAATPPPIATVPVAPVVPVQPPCTPPIQVIPVIPVVPAPVAVVPQNPLPGPPVMPAACDPTGMAYQGPELTITPSRFVAPVNSEVVMAAGIRSPDGFYVMRQPLEWMLAQDGVGQIVAVGHEGPHNTSYVLRNSPQKLATNYVRAHTSTISQTLDRGTPSPVDDVYLHRGQSWVSITSPTEGTTHVVVWTPKEQNWERRKATATIYWVDAAWRFPQGVTARSGQPQPLTTIVTRSRGEPISGWVVRYELVDGPPAAFSRSGATVIEVRTDGAGRATADLMPLSSEPGITTVRVQIIRPQVARGDLPQMVVGQSNVGVQWTTPGLTVRSLGTSSTSANGAIAYRVEISNSGDLATHNVALNFTPPTGVIVLNSTPPAQVFGQRLQWQLGHLPPGTTSVVELNCRAKVAGSIRGTFVASSREIPRVESGVATEVRVNALAIKMTGPETSDVGREAKFLIDVTNTGSTPLTNITATDTFEPGLAHAGGERSPILRPIPELAPGQT